MECDLCCTPPTETGQQIFTHHQDGIEAAFDFQTWHLNDPSVILIDEVVQMRMFQGSQDGISCDSFDLDINQVVLVRAHAVDEVVVFTCSKLVVVDSMQQLADRVRGHAFHWSQLPYSTSFLFLDTGIVR